MIARGKLSYKAFTMLFQNFQVINNWMKMQQGMTQQANMCWNFLYISIYAKAGMPGKTRIKYEVS